MGIFKFSVAKQRLPIVESVNRFDMDIFNFIGNKLFNIDLNIDNQTPKKESNNDIFERKKKQFLTEKKGIDQKFVFQTIHFHLFDQ
jgi:hypothetical protein